MLTHLSSIMILAAVIWQPPPSTSSQSTVLVDITKEDPEFTAVEEEMQSTIREHRDQGHAGKSLFTKENMSKKLLPNF